MRRCCLAEALSIEVVSTPAPPAPPLTARESLTDVGDIGFVNFLLDSGSSGALITSELRETLGLTPLDGQVGREERGEVVGFGG